MDSEHGEGRGIGRRVCRVIATMWALMLAPLGLVLLFSAATTRGHVCACLALLVAILPLALECACRKRVRARSVCLVVCAGIAAGLAVTVATLAPEGLARADARVAHAFAGEDARFSRYAMGNLVPESDQLLMGLRLVPLVDPLLNADSAEKLSAWTASIYRELEADPDFQALGSMLPDAYDALLNTDWRPTHSYVYVPARGTSGAPLPLLVFFHGSGGNFKAYIWILSKLADRLGFVVVAPSGGFGNWPLHDTEACLSQAMAAAGRRAAVDPTRVHVMGLSNGGRAVSQLAARQGARFASMTFISPAFDVPEIESAEFVMQCTGKRVLVVTGRKDNRVPWDYVNQNTDTMKTAGARVTLRTFEEADHFLMFGDRDELLVLLESWLRAGG